MKKTNITNWFSYISSFEACEYGYLLASPHRLMRRISKSFRTQWCPHRPGPIVRNVNMILLCNNDTKASCVCGWVCVHVYIHTLNNTIINKNANKRILTNNCMRLDYTPLRRLRLRNVVNHVVGRHHLFVVLRMRVLDNTRWLGASTPPFLYPCIMHEYKSCAFCALFFCTSI